MQDKDSYFILSTTRVLGLRTVYGSAISSNTMLTHMFDELETHQAEAVSFALKLDNSTITYTEAGVAAREKAALSFSIAASVMSAYGAKHSMSDLEGLKRYTYSELRKQSLSNQVIETNVIKAAVNAHTTQLANIGIDAAFVTILTDDLAMLETVTLLPQNMKDQHKNDNTLFAEKIHAMGVLFDKQIDRTMQLYRITNMPFFLAYTAARKVRHHHLKRSLPTPDPESTTGILETLVLDKDTLEPLAGVQLLVLLLNIVSTTDDEGETYDDEITPGTYQGKLIYEGYKDVEFTLTIEAGKTCTLQFVMEKVPVV